MTLDTDFLFLVIKKYAVPGTSISITDQTARTLVSTEEQSIGTVNGIAQYVVRSLSYARIENAPMDSDGREHADIAIYGVPLFFEEELCGTVITQGASGDALAVGNTVRTALETALELQRFNQRAASEANEQYQIARLLLAGNVDTNQVSALMLQREMDLNNLRCVVCVHISYHQTSYFNNNLSLGYLSSIEQIRSKIISLIRSNKFLTSQDIVHAYDRNTVVIIKSFIPMSDLSRIYRALDKICEEIDSALREVSGFSSCISYGSIYPGVTRVRDSFHEAMETTDIGNSIKPGKTRYVLEDILYENVCRYLHPQVVGKILEPALHALEKADEKQHGELLDCAEAFVDNCLSLSKTSERIYLHRNTISARLDKLRAATGLDPAARFDDAFIVKMLAAFVRLSRIQPPQASKGVRV